MSSTANVNSGKKKRRSTKTRIAMLNAADGGSLNTSSCSNESSESENSEIKFALHRASSASIFAKTEQQCVNNSYLKEDVDGGTKISNKKSDKDSTTYVPISQRVLQNFALETWEDDYLFAEYQEIAEDFAYVCFFTAVFPWIAMWSAIHIITEMKSDAYKFHVNVRRVYRNTKLDPLSAYLTVFEAIALLGVAVNCGLMCIKYRAEFSYSTILVVEHVFILFKLYLSVAIPDTPESLYLKKVIDKKVKIARE